VQKASTACPTFGGAKSPSVQFTYVILRVNEPRIRWCFPSDYSGCATSKYVSTTWPLVPNNNNLCRLGERGPALTLNDGDTKAESEADRQLPRSPSLCTSQSKPVLQRCASPVRRNRKRSHQRPGASYVVRLPFAHFSGVPCATRNEQPPRRTRRRPSSLRYATISISLRTKAPALICAFDLTGGTHISR